MSVHLHYDWISSLLFLAFDDSGLWLTLGRIHFWWTLVWICRELFLKLHELRFLDALSRRRRGLDLDLLRLTVVDYLYVRLINCRNEID